MSTDPVQEARKSTVEAEKLANELKSALGDFSCSSSEQCHAPGAPQDDAEPEKMPQGGTSAGPGVDSLVPESTVSHRLCQQLQVEKDMRSCVESVLAHERAHSRKLQMLLEGAQQELRKVAASQSKDISTTDAEAILHAHQEAVGRERAGAALAVKEIKSISERALQEGTAAWQAEKETLLERISRMEEDKEREFDELQRQVSVLEAALHHSQSDSQAALARSKARNRLLQRKVKECSTEEKMGKVEHLELDKAALSEELEGTKQRCVELEALHKRVSNQVSHEKAARKDAEQALHTCTREKDALEAACDDAAKEISELRSEVSAVKRSLEDHENSQETEELYGRELSIAAAHTNAAQQEAKEAHQLLKEALVSVLDLLAPSCVSPLLTCSTTGQSHDRNDTLKMSEESDATEFYSMRLQITSSSQVSKGDVRHVVDRLTGVVGNAVYAAERAAQVEATLQSRKAAAEASAQLNIPAYEAELERCQVHIADLVQLLDATQGELEDAHSRLSQSADTAEGLANTLRDQETEIRILHAALEDAQDEAANAVANSQQISVKLQNAATQTEASANRISQQLLVEDPESRLLDMERALQSKERHIEDLTQELASSHASQLYGHGAAPDHDLNSHSRLNCPCCNPSSGTFSAAVQVRCTHADGLKEQLIDHWRAGVSVAQRTLAQLREQHECPSAEEIAMAVSKAQETASALNACASMHEFGFSFDFMRDGIPAQAGTVAVDALSQALRAAHMHVLHSSKLYNGESLHKLQGAWSAMRYACRMLSDQLEGEAGPMDSPTEESVPAYLDALIQSVNTLPDVARKMVARVASSVADTEAARKEQEEQRVRLESAEADNSRLQEQLSGLLARCDQDLQQVREETQAAQSLAHDQIAELLVMSQTDLKNVQKSLTAACENQQHQADQLAQQQAKLDEASQDVAEAKAQAVCAEKARDAEMSAAAVLRTDLEAARQRVQELQQQLCKVRASAARAKLSSNAVSPRKARLPQFGGRGDKIVIPTHEDNEYSHTVLSSPDHSSKAIGTVDMSSLMRQMNVSNRKLTRAVKEKTELAQEVKELKARCERLDALQGKLSDRRSELELANKKITTQLATVEAKLMQEKEHHEIKDEQLKLLLESSSAQQKASEKERSAWLAQLEKAECVAQDARQALVQKQDQCQELQHALAEVKGELAMCRQNRDDSDKQAEQLLADLKLAQVTLSACQSDLEESKMLLMEKEATLVAWKEQASYTQDALQANSIMNRSESGVPELSKVKVGSPANPGGPTVGVENCSPERSTEFCVRQLRDIISQLSDEKAELKEQLNRSQEKATEAEERLQHVTSECSKWSDELVNAQSDVKQAVAAKDATLSAQDAQIKSLQNELDVTKEELSVTRDGLNQATMELENVQALIQTRLGREARVCVDRSVSTSPARSEEPEHGYSSHCASPGYMGTDLGQAMSSMMGSQGEQDRHEWGTQHEDYASLASSGDVAVEDGGVGQERTAGAVACASSVQQPRVDSNSEVLFMLSQKIQDLDDALDALQLAEAHADGLQAEKRDLRAALNAARQLCSETQRQFERSNEETQCQKDQVTALQSELSSRQQELKDVRDEAKVYQQRLLALSESAVADAAQLRAELGNREADLAECKNQNSSLSMERMRESSKMGVLEDNLEAMRTEAQKRIEELGQQHATIEKLKSSLSVMQAELASEQCKAKDAVGLKDELDASLGRLRDELQALQVENVSLKEEANSCKQREQQLSEHLDELSKESEACKRALSRSEDEVKQTSAELAKNREEMACNIAQLACEQEKAKQAVGEKDELQNSLTRLQGEMKALKKENSSMNGEIRSCKEKEKKCLERSRQLSEELESCRVKMHNAAEEVECISAELTKSREELASKTAQALQIEDTLSQALRDVADAQSAEAKAAEQCAADYAELAEARKKIDFLQKQGKVLDSKSPKSRQGRGKGKHLGHVYDGDYLRRDGHPDNAEAGAARCEKCKEAEEKAQAQTQIAADLQAKADADITALKKHIAELSERLAAQAQSRSGAGISGHEANGSGLKGSGQGLQDITTAEEQLLKMEMTELQHSLSEARGEADGARETAENAVTSLQEAQATHKRDVEALNETIERLEEDLQKEKLRSDDAQCTLQVLQEQLDLAHAGAPTSACTEQNKDVPSDNTSSALWQELDVARNEAASAKASAAEARANAESAVVQLEQLGSTHRGLLNDIRDLLCGPGAPQPDSSCQGIIAQLERCMQQRSSLEQQLSETRKRLVEEQESAVEMQGEIDRQRRAAEAAQVSADAKEQQLEHWKSRVGRKNVPCNSTESSAQPVMDDVMSATADSHPTTSATAGHKANSSVTDIVSKWRSVSLKQINETHSLAEQLSAERKAAHSLRSQALMLERQLETSEDQLESERASASARESTIRTQLANLEAQVAEQEGLLKLRGSGMAAAEAHAESVSAELKSAKERVQSLEDMVKATESELQSAIHQISEMHNVVMATDVKLCDAQSISADRDAAVPALERCLATVHRIMCKPYVSSNLMEHANPAEHATNQLTQLLLTVEQDCSRRQVGIEKLSAQCQELEDQVQARNSSAQEVKVKLRDVTEQLEQRTSELAEVKSQLDKATAGMQQWQQDAQHSAAKVASATTDKNSLTKEVEQRNQEIAALKAALETEALSLQSLRGRYDARCEEASSLQGQVHTAQEMARQLQDQLSQADSDIRRLQSETAAAVASQEAAQRDAEELRARSQSLSSRLQDSDSRLTSMHESLEKRQQEVRELNSMLKAWEAMRLSKDAQIAALMERCKRYDEDIAEKGRSNEALRRKLMHHHHSTSSVRGSVSAAGSERNASRNSVAGSVAGSLSGSDAGRVRHIHLHMHPGSHPAEQTTDASYSAEQYAELERKGAVNGALVPHAARSSTSGGATYSSGHRSRLDQRHSYNAPR